MADLTLLCRVCEYEGFPDLGWQKFTNGTEHLGAWCPACGRHIKWVPQTNSDGGPSAWMDEAPSKAFSTQPVITSSAGG